MNRHHTRGTPWWRGAATHMWRVYFRYKKDGRKPDSEPKRKSFLICNKIIKDMNEQDLDFLSGYFQSEWGKDAAFVENYSKESGIGMVRLWRLVEDANRRLFEESGLLEPQRRDGD